MVKQTLAKLPIQAPLILNQACAPGFLELLLSVNFSVCVCVCPAPEAINN